MKKINLLILLAVLSFAVQAQRDPNNPQARPATPAPATAPARPTPAPTPSRSTPATAPASATPARESRTPVVAETGSGGTVPNQGITSALHQSHLNQIVFTKEFVDKESIQESDLISNTTVFSPLSMRFYLDNCLTNYGLKRFPSATPASVRDDSKLKFVWYLDGQKVSDGFDFNNYLDNSELDLYTTVVYPIFESEGAGVKTAPAWDNFVLDAGHLVKKGSHKIKLELYFIVNLEGGTSIGPLATGEITMNFPTDLVNPADPRVCLPAPYKSDVALEAKMIGCFKAQGWKEIPQKAIIQSDWETVYHSVSGKVTGRKFWGAVSSKIDGKCMYQQFKFFQQGPGGNYAGELTIIETGAQPNVHCGCMK